MSAREQAFKDIKEYLTPIALSEDLRRKQDSAKWLPYADLYTYDYDRGYSMKISHFKALLKQ